MEIIKQENELIWLASANCPTNFEVTVPEGLQAIVICDGAVNDVLAPGIKKINLKGMFSKALGKCWDVYGVNTSETVELPWGCQVKYQEQKYEIVVTAKISGRCEVKIENGLKLFPLIDGGNSINATFLRDKLRSVIINEAETVISRHANQFRDFSKIEESKKLYTDEIRSGLRRKLSDEYGLHIINIEVRINEFDGLEEIWQLEKERAKTGINADIAQNEGAAMQAIGQGIDALKGKQEEPKKSKGLFNLKGE